MFNYIRYNEKMDIKTVSGAIAVAIVSYLTPIGGFLESLAVIFTLNFLFGYLSDRLHGKDFSFKKAFRCIVEGAIFCLLVCAVYFIGERSHSEEGGRWFVSYVTYALFYFYGCNILRNLKLIFRHGSTPYSVVSFLYWFISIEFIKTMPYLSDYLNKKQEEGDEAKE